MRRIFLSDVHLSPQDAVLTERFVRFLGREAPRTQEFYVLGDLFDYWIGPAHLDLPDYREALDALRRVTASGVKVFFVLGNRDFYMRRRFGPETGIRVVPRRTRHRVTADGKRLYLCHGDALEGRFGWGRFLQWLIRTWPVEALYTRLPTHRQTTGAKYYRQRSLAQKPPCPGRPSPRALQQEFARGTDIIICGHFHRQAEDRRRSQGREAVLYTLGDWSKGESYLVEEDGRWTLYPTPEGKA